MLRSPSFPYVAPFIAFLGYLAIRSLFPVHVLREQILCLGAITVILIWVSRPVLDFRVRNVAGSVALGIAVCAVWVAPEAIWPGYRMHWLFSNPFLGTPQPGLSEAARSNTLVLMLRAARASVIVPIVEELFWRAWLMRWMIQPDFEKLPLGTWSARSFWIVAVLFASEHGSYWEVGLLAGIAYNWWMLKTKSLGDLILTHAVTNASLSAYVVLTGRWQFWS